MHHGEWFRVFKAALITACLAFGIAVAVGTLVAEDRPNYAEMRDYRISQLSDEQIRKLHEDAKREFEESRHREDEAIKNQQIKRERDWQRCKDIVFKERNPYVCQVGIMTEPIRQYASVNDAYEKLLMGVCLYAETRAKAIEFGCLPSR